MRENDMRKSLCAAVFLVLLGSCTVFGQAGSFDVSGFIGGNFAGEKLGSGYFPFLDTTTPFKLDQNFLVGFRVTYHYTHVLSFEGSFTAVPGSLKTEIRDPQELTRSDLKVLDASTYLLSANATYNFPVRERYIVFISAGIGTATVSTGSPVGFADLAPPEGSTHFAFNVGTGLKYHLGDRFYLRGDLRKYFFEEDFDYSGLSENPGVLELSFGLGYVFGGRHGF
jgi:outer membrane beta-barrel protein